MVLTQLHRARDDLLSCSTCWVVQVPKKVNGARVADFEGIFHHVPIHQSPTSQESNSRISIKYKLFQFYAAMFHLFSGAPVPRKFPILWDHLWQEMGNYGKKKIVGIGPLPFIRPGPVPSAKFLEEKLCKSTEK